MQPYLGTSQSNGTCATSLSGPTSNSSAMDEQQMDLLLSVINDQQQQPQTPQSQQSSLNGVQAASPVQQQQQQQSQQSLLQQAHQSEQPVVSNSTLTNLLQQILQQQQQQQPQQQQQQQPALSLQPATASQLAYACGGSSDLSNLLQALASQTAQMQSVILALLKQQHQQQQQQVHLLQPQRLVPAANDSFLKTLIAELEVKAEPPEQQRQLTPSTVSASLPASSTLRSILTDSSTSAAIGRYAAPPAALNLWQHQQQPAEQQMQQQQLPSADQLISLSREAQPSQCLVAPVSASAITVASSSSSAPPPDVVGATGGGSSSGGGGGNYKYKRARVSDTAMSSSSSPASSSCTSPARSRSPITVVDSDTQLSSIRRDCGELFLGSASEEEPGILSGEASSLRSELLKRRNSAAAAAAAAAAASGSSFGGGQDRQASSIEYGSVSSCRSDEVTSSPASVHTNFSGDAGSDRRRSGKPSLFNCYPRKHGPFELLIVSQPEQHHRARYMTEGSRGSVKDRSQQGYPTVQLIGWSQPASLSIFVGTDVGRVKPHGYYQACRVSGKATACEAVETEQEGTRVLEVPFDPQKNMILNLDCVGILKLRNADVEQKRGVGKNRKKSIKARLVFRVNLPLGGGNFITLQAASDPIVCSECRAES
ncbi:hypothetical protein BOX15_Mlig033763g1 [Macrostomum lignano]|uniref:RHD domain-containing protein n=1 Tax=Macrostomum lignano TaxID=282301 RepID=A0A267DD56_9PLAT|nr:hypothetical protein BOX15_Mlig033763g1 [Macrostomum lignano]